MNNKENLIIEQRTNDARKLGYFGINGKLFLIASMLGEEIFQQNSGYCNFTPLEDFYDLGDVDDEIIRSLEGDETSSCVGLVFSGLKNGDFFQIMFKAENNEIKVEFKGDIVYHEIDNELFCFNPFQEWQSKVEKYTNIANQKQKNQKDQLKQEELSANKKAKENYVKELKQKWGI